MVQRNMFGGAKPNIPKQEKVKAPEMPAIEPPPPLPPPVPIPPVPTTSALEVQEAQTDQRKQASKRKGVSKSLIAGETGGYLGNTSAPTSASKSLLG